MPFSLRLTYVLNTWWYPQGLWARMALQSMPKCKLTVLTTTENQSNIQSTNPLQRRRAFISVTQLFQRAWFIPLCTLIGNKSSFPGVEFDFWKSQSSSRCLMKLRYTPLYSDLVVLVLGGNLKHIQKLYIQIRSL